MDRHMPGTHRFIFLLINQPYTQGEKLPSVASPS